MSGPRCCFCGNARGGVYTKRNDPVAGPLDCCAECDTSYRERDRQAAALHSAERAVLEAATNWWKMRGRGMFMAEADALSDAVARYRALLDGKAEGKEA